MAGLRMDGQIDLFGPAMMKVINERRKALDKHGPLKPGPDRWCRVLQEEMEEVADELLTTCIPGSDYADARKEAADRAIIELAQLAQLAIGVIELLQQGKIQEEA